MTSLLLFIFFLQLAIYIINTIGGSTVDNLLWLLYLRSPLAISKDVRKHGELKRDVLQLKREMNATSSQDEFAKWAKLRRRHDKALEEYEAMNQSLNTRKTSFEFYVKTARRVGTGGLRFFIQTYYTKTPVFQIPRGWFPYPVEWILSFPRAPLGSVSNQVWGSACVTAIALVADEVTALLQKNGQTTGNKQPQAVPADDKTK